MVLGYSMGTPGVYFSLPEFGNQSELLEDLGIKNWKINLMEIEEEELIKSLTKIHKKYVDALVNIDQIKKPIAKGQDELIQYAGKLLYSNKGGKSLLDRWKCQIGKSAPESVLKIIGEVLDA